MIDPFERYRQASKIGWSALVRLKAEILLKREPSEFTTPLTEDERELLHRIASAPQDGDNDIVNDFCDRVKLEDDEEAE